MLFRRGALLWLSRLAPMWIFNIRDPQGSVSVDIFMSHAMPGVEYCDDHVKFVHGILNHCGGLPIPLAVTGDAVALRLKAGLRFGTACGKYFELLSNEMHSGLSVLDAAISLSLDSLQ